MPKLSTPSRQEYASHGVRDAARLHSVPPWPRLPSVHEEHHELGQFIPLVYHFNMLADDARMAAFKEAIGLTVSAGQTVLELGGGTGVLSFFAAQTSARVLCVEQNAELVQQARRILAINATSTPVVVIHADAFDYLPPDPVDVVICEMLHVGMLREKQLQVIESFKQRYLERFGPPLPVFIPEAYFQAVQPVQHSFDYHGYRAPTPVFQDPLAVHPRTFELGGATVFQSASYGDKLPLDCAWSGTLTITESGELNALRFITKNILAVVPTQQRTVDWTNQYLVVPLEGSINVARGQKTSISFAYQAGDPVNALRPKIEWVR